MAIELPEASRCDEIQASHREHHGVETEHAGISTKPPARAPAKAPAVFVP